MMMWILEEWSRDVNSLVGTDWQKGLASWCEVGYARLSDLPPPDSRGEAEVRLATRIKEAIHEARVKILRHNVEFIYAALTDDCRDFHRLHELVARASEQFPGLLPTRAQLEADARLPLSKKEGHEIDQANFAAEILANVRAGAHLMTSMRLPKDHSVELLEDFIERGELDLGKVKLHRAGDAGYLTLSNPSFLNAEDAELLSAMETAVDLILLDPNIKIGVLRGGVIQHPKYDNRRVFCSGINLTHLYQGKIPFLFFVVRELGLVSKMYRGLVNERVIHTDTSGDSTEKPWILAVESHAIGGGCQLALVADYVLAEERAFYSIPARYEGFVPGAANLRLPRYVGRRMANRMIYLNHRVPANSPGGQLLTDRLVEAGAMDDAIDETAEEFIGSGTVGLSSNRKAFRLSEEPLEVFRAYIATFAREQARCLYSADLTKNLELYWNKRRWSRDLQ